MLFLDRRLEVSLFAKTVCRYLQGDFRDPPVTA
jgi:hypothetical protein